MLVSVIIPNYNHAAYLRQRIDSVLNQTYRNFEVIIMDDCSVDNSREVIESYSACKEITQVIYGETNSGSTFKQWEKGISAASGEFIWIAESDDWCEPTLLEFLVQGLEQDPECVISYCQSYCVQNSNEINWISKHDQLSEMVDGKSFMRDQMLNLNPIFNASMVLWRKSMFPQISQAYKNYKLCGDWLFWMELCLLGKVHISGRVLNYFRKHDDNVSGKALKSGLNFIEILDVLNILYQHQLIYPKDYNKALKTQFREYYPIRKTFEPTFRSKIERQFKKPLTSKLTYYKILTGTLWKSIKKIKKCPK